MSMFLFAHYTFLCIITYSVGIRSLLEFREGVDARFHVDVLHVYDGSDPTYYLRTESYVASTSIMIDRTNIGREESFFSPFLPHKF